LIVYRKIEQTFFKKRHVVAEFRKGCSLNVLLLIIFR